MPQYDFIGDIHGHASELKALLEKMGYRLKDGCYRHPDRQAIFLGDFIDRGQEQREVIAIVRPMIDSRTALTVMGNHEFNAICYATRGGDGAFIRKHTPNNTRQHQAFLNAYPEGSGDYNEIVGWFKTLPVYLALDGADLVHACWCEESMATLAPLLNLGHTLTEEAILGYGRKDPKYYDTLETLLKGPEHDLPPGIQYKDPDGHVRTRTRVRWWLDSSLPVSQRLDFPDPLTDEQRQAIDRTRITPLFKAGARPIFIGHYWLNGEPEPLTARTACVDYSVAKKGKLVAYRWNGEPSLDKRNFIW